MFQFGDMRSEDGGENEADAEDAVTSSPFSSYSHSQEGAIDLSSTDSESPDQ